VHSIVHTCSSVNAQDVYPSAICDKRHFTCCSVRICNCHLWTISLSSYWTPSSVVIAHTKPFNLFSFSLSVSLVLTELHFLTWRYAVFGFQPPLLPEIFCGFFHSLTANDTKIPHVCNPFLTHMYFAVHYSLPICQSTPYNTPVNESNVNNMRCPDFVKGTR